MNTSLNIPKRINVGFQKRGGTYTGKLAYIIYWDNKGKLRKEKSWDGWRDHKIANEEFDNTPTEGFVLNKSAGGYSSGWNHRQKYIRVYDPRGFEFEISVENLLFILQECDAYKGKGLDGEFVYSWHGKDLVLLPCSSEDYKASQKHNEIQEKKITKADMVEGCTYMDKSQKNLVYLGRHDYAQSKWNSNAIGVKKGHIFHVVDKNTYQIENGFTNLAARTSEHAVDNYPDLLEDFLEKTTGLNRVNKLVIKETKLDPQKNIQKGYYYNSGHKSSWFRLEDGSLFYGAFFQDERGYSYYYGDRNKIRSGGMIVELKSGMIKGTEVKSSYYSRSNKREVYYKDKNDFSRNVTVLDVQLELDNGEIVDFKDYEDTVKKQARLV